MNQPPEKQPDKFADLDITQWFIVEDEAFKAAVQQILTASSALLDAEKFIKSIAPLANKNSPVPALFTATLKGVHSAKDNLEFLYNTLAPLAFGKKD